jgi:hypothetical protein
MKYKFNGANKLQLSLVRTCGNALTAVHTILSYCFKTANVKNKLKKCKSYKRAKYSNYHTKKKSISSFLIEVCHYAVDGSQGFLRRYRITSS